MVGFPGGASGKETACQFRRRKRLQGKGLGNQFRHPLPIGRRGCGSPSQGPELLLPGAVSTGREGGYCKYLLVVCYICSTLVEQNHYFLTSRWCINLQNIWATEKNELFHRRQSTKFRFQEITGQLIWLFQQIKFKVKKREKEDRGGSLAKKKPKRNIFSPPPIKKKRKSRQS